MFASLKKKLAEKKRLKQAVCDSQHWKNRPALQSCLQAMRGSCTVAPMELHEAVAAVVNIALAEDNWSPSDKIPADFLAPTVYVIWDDPLLPVLTADRELLLENLSHMTAVTENVFLVSQTMDRAVHLRPGALRLYSVSPED